MQSDYSAATMPPVEPTEPAADVGFFARLIEKVGANGARYSAVSVVNVLVGQGLLLFFTGVLHKGWTRSNIAAVLISAVPAYYMNRAWVWRKRGKSSFKTEVLPFWIFVGIGLVFSTVAVTAVGRMQTGNKLLPNVANIGAFGVLWVLRFFILDKLFHQPHLDMYEAAEEIVEHHHLHHHPDRADSPDDAGPTDRSGQVGQSADGSNGG